MIRSWFALMLLLVAAGLQQGCTEQTDASVVEFVADVKRQKTGQIEPLPVFQAPKAFKFTATKLRDPFEPFVTSLAVTKPGVRNEESPDLNRPREFLEQFPLDSLKMVGTLERDGEFFALLKGSNNSLYRVNVGEYIGQNSGKIEKITDKTIEVKEWLSDGKGGWREHWVVIRLAR